MGCDDRARLWAYTRGQLEAPARAALEAHLLECDDCRSELAAMRATQEVLSEAEEPGPRPASEPRANPPRRRGFARRWPLQSAPAVLMVVAGVGAVILAFLSTSAPSVPEAVVDGQPLAAGTSRNELPTPAVKRSAAPDERRLEPLTWSELALPGGRSVRVEPGARLRVVEAEPAGSVLELAHGAAAIAVAGGAVAGDAVAGGAAGTVIELRAGEAVVRLTLGAKLLADVSDDQIRLALAGRDAAILLPDGVERWLPADRQTTIGRPRWGLVAAPLAAGQREALQAVELPREALAPRPAGTSGAATSGGAGGEAAPGAAVQGALAPGAARAADASAPAAPKGVAAGRLPSSGKGAGPVEPPSASELAALAEGERALVTRHCGGAVIEALQRIGEGSAAPRERERARILAARCLRLEGRGAEADEAFRGYLREFPSGAFAEEARIAVAH